MKAITTATLFALFTLTMGSVSAQNKGTQEMVVPLSDPGKPVTLHCSLMSGSIKVTGYEGKDVQITVSLDTTKDEDDADESEGMKRIGTNGGIDIRAEEHDNNVEIHTGGLMSKITGVSIKVPQNTSRVDVSTVNNGNVEVTNINGKVEIGDVNGEIVAKGISGSVVANTVNGDIIVVFKSVDPKAAMAFSTLNGKIELSLPADTKANLKLKSDNGEIFSDFDVAVDKASPKVVTKNEEHYHEIRIDDWVYGTINGGGPEIMMQSTFGKLYIRKVK
ncbi:MAG TPA: DUF4097 family beta strand repeat-containing protein [Puia sp.]|nr:DUF4097 family beta strand repeat-containing protein [Puia sp.]